MKDVPEQLWHESFRRRAFRRVMDGTPTERRGGAPSGIKRLDKTLNALTITSAAVREFIHPDYDRPLTLREAARLQSFPDRFQFMGGANSVAAQIGNAFPPIAAQKFAEHMIALDGLIEEGKSSYSGGQLLGFHLTDSSGGSPALIRTRELLDSLLSPQNSLEFDSPAASGWA